MSAKLAMVKRRTKVFYVALERLELGTAVY